MAAVVPVATVAAAMVGAPVAAATEEVADPAAVVAAMVVMVAEGAKVVVAEVEMAATGWCSRTSCSIVHRFPRARRPTRPIRQCRSTMNQGPHNSTRSVGTDLGERRHHLGSLRKLAHCHTEGSMRMRGRRKGRCSLSS